MRLRDKSSLKAPKRYGQVGSEAPRIKKSLSMPPDAAKPSAEVELRDTVNPVEQQVETAPAQNDNQQNDRISALENTENSAS